MKARLTLKRRSRPDDQPRHRSPWWTIVGSLLSFVAGGIIATLFQEFLTNAEIIHRVLTPPTAGVIFDVLLALILLCLVGIGIVVVEWARQTAEWARQTGELRARVGVKTRYIEVNPHSNDQTLVYSAAREIVERAKKNIFAVVSYRIEGTQNIHESANKDRAGYFDALIERTKHGVKYVRIIQVHAGESLKYELGGETSDSVTHYRRMISESVEHHNTNIGLFEVARQRPLTFVLVDNTYLIWQVNELLPSGQMRMHGILIIEDLDGTLVNSFFDFYERLYGDLNRIAVRMDELPAPAVTASES